MGYTIKKHHDPTVALGLDAILFPGSISEGPDKGNVYWVATNEEHEYVGFSSIRDLHTDRTDPEWGQTAYLSRTGVLPSSRRRGLQRRFIRVRLRWARSRGYRRVVTYCSWGNIGSIRALVREGFLPYDPEFHWVGDVIYLERDL